LQYTYRSSVADRRHVACADQQVKSRRRETRIVMASCLRLTTLILLALDATGSPVKAPVTYDDTSILQVNTTLTYSFSAELGVMEHATDDGTCTSSTTQLPALLTTRQSATGLQVRQDVVLHGKSRIDGGHDHLHDPCDANTVTRQRDRLPFWLQNITYGGMINHVPHSTPRCWCDYIKPNVSDCSTPPPEACRGDETGYHMEVDYSATPLTLFLHVTPDGSVTAHRVWKDAHGQEQCNPLYATPFTKNELLAVFDGFNYPLLALDLWLYHTTSHALPWGGDGMTTVSDSFFIPTGINEGPLNLTTHKRCLLGGQGPPWMDCGVTSMIVNYHSEKSKAWVGKPVMGKNTLIECNGQSRWNNGGGEDFGSGGFSFRRTLDDKPAAPQLPASFFDLPAACGSISADTKWVLESSLTVGSGY